jgi:hypothetical protein
VADDGAGAGGTDSARSPDRPVGGSATSGPGWREVLIVAVAVVALALGAAAVTGLLPPAGQDVIFRTPLVIVVLIVGTIGLMVRLATRRPPA